MTTKRITVTLPDRIAQALRKRARDQHRPVSQIVAEALKQQQGDEFRQLMVEAYKASAELNRELADESFEADKETWPAD